jgi:hypothetical protein
MRTLLLLLSILLSLSAKSQSKHTIYYTAEVMHSNLMEFKSDLTSKSILKKVVGVDVEIEIDTMFKKYTISFTDKDDKRTMMNLSYVRDYFMDSDNDPRTGKIYLMSYSGLTFMLIDYINLAIFNELEIRMEEKKDNYTMVFEIKNIVRASGKGKNP